MKILTVIGARPQFIKSATVSRELSKYKDIVEVIVHTGQHFDENMSSIFFEQMQIPKPHYNLNVHGCSHAEMTGIMLNKIEKILLKEKPDLVLVYGDTNSTLAGALAAKKINIKVAHVEAGLRSFNMKMPEEINRILTDRISDILFCPTRTAMENLHKEGFHHFNCKLVQSGDVMFDGAIFFQKLAIKPRVNIENNYILCTVHRAENTDNENRLIEIFQALEEIAKNVQIILPLHPRTKQMLNKLNLNIKNLSIIEPVGYLEMVWLINNCHIVMTDSGGLQKEAYFFKKPCITLRDETEWVELVSAGYNILSGANYSNILDAYKLSKEIKVNNNMELYGNGHAAQKIVEGLQI